jgi:hypothetical protein
MATHPILIDRLNKALSGHLLPGGKSLGIEPGSGNYVSMSAAYCDLDAVNRGDEAAVRHWDSFWIDRLEEQERIGILAHAGPKGMQIEQGCPAPHDGFNLLPVLGVWRSSLQRGQTALADLCERNVGAQLAYRREFSVKGVSCPPCVRAKSKNDPSNGSGLDQWQSRVADRLNTMLWTNRATNWPPNSCEAILSGLLRGKGGDDIRQRLRKSPFPKVYVPVLRADLPNGNWLAWLQPDNGLALLDPLSWVEFGPTMRFPVLGYGNKPRPDLPDGVEPKIVGGE